MMTYDTYKESGIDWLGNENPIPSHWKVERVKDKAKYQSGDYISALDLDEENTYPVYGGNGFRGLAKNFNHDGNFILIGRQGALCGNINYASGKFWATEHAVIVYIKKRVNFYWLGELLRIMNLNQYSLSAAQPGLSVDRIKRLELPVPPVSEQNAIAQYLDSKTKAIDKKVKLLEQKIDYYKELRKSLINDAVTKGLDKTVELKESGIDWIGQIPEHWDSIRIKDAFKTLAGGTPSTKSPEYWDGDIPWIQSGKVQNNIVVSESVSDFITPLGLKESSTKIAIDKSVLIALTGATCSNIGYLTFNTTINQSIVAISNKDNSNTKYLFYFLLAAKEKIRTLMSGGAQGGINQEDVKFLKIAYPPQNEQLDIAKYLDQKTATIDKIIKNINDQIDLLKEQRKSLINDVVTGKIKVVE